MSYPQVFKNHLPVKRRIKILMVDDHPMILSGYELTLKTHSENYEWNVGKAHNCDEALRLLQKSTRNPFQIVLLDINLPSSALGDIKNGEDLGQKIKKLYPEIKIIVLTMLNDRLRLKTILKNLEPNAFIVKSEITADILLDAIVDVLANKKCYCKEVKKLFPFETSYKENVTDLDLKILYYISIGEKMKNLPQFIPLSMATIERRKKNLKILFNIEDESDRKLLAIAKDKGFL